MVTNNAKGLISIIAYEVRLADQRVAGGHITQTQAMGCIIERLNAKAKENVDLKTFLTTMAYVPDLEDEGKEFPWAEDRREPRAHVTTDVDVEHEVEFPEPGARVC